jgi:hypothetical protein
MGQRFSTPTVSALIMSQETVICALVSYLTLNETLTAVEVCGCVIMMVATIVALIPNSDHNAEDDELPRNWTMSGPFEDSVGLLELATTALSLEDGAYSSTKEAGKR